MKIFSRIFGKKELKEENKELHKELKLLSEESLERDMERDNQEKQIQLLKNQLSLYEDCDIKKAPYVSFDKDKPFKTEYYYYIETKNTLPDTLKLLHRQNLYVKLLENTLDENQLNQAKETFDKLLEIKCNGN